MMKLNPIVKKDLQVSARSMRLSCGLFVYVDTCFPVGISGDSGVEQLYLWKW